MHLCWLDYQLVNQKCHHIIRQPALKAICIIRLKTEIPAAVHHLQDIIVWICKLNILKN